MLVSSVNKHSARREIASRACAAQSANRIPIHFCCIDNPLLWIVWEQRIICITFFVVNIVFNRYFRVRQSKLCIN